MEAQPQAQLTGNDIIRKLTEVADEFGVNYNAAITLLYNAIGELVSQSNKLQGTEQGRIHAKQIVHAYLMLMYKHYGERMQAGLEEAKIQSGTDVGRLVLAFCDKGLLMREENDQLSDFDHLFTTNDVEAYMEREGLKSRPTPVLVKRLTNGLFIAGIIIIFLSIIKLIPPGAELLGWGVVLSGLVLIVATGWRGKPRQA